LEGDQLIRPLFIVLMVNRFKVVDSRKVIRVEARLESKLKGLRVRQVQSKLPKTPVRANKKRASSTVQKAVDGAGPPSLHSWHEDPPLLVFEPELKSSFDSTSHTKASFLLKTRIAGFDYVSVPA
jgi:hypothetical protein